MSQAFAIIYHFVGLVPVAVIGVIAALQQGINFAALNSAEQGQGEVVGSQREIEKRESP